MKKPIVPVVAFFLALALLAGLTFGIPAREFSPNENRVLAGMPELTLQNVLSGAFQEELSAFLSDQIPLREFWIGMNTQIKKMLGKKEINGVYLGADGYYIQQFTEDDYSQSRFTAVLGLLKQFAGRQNVPVALMAVPTPGVVLQDKLPSNAPMYEVDGIYDRIGAVLKEYQHIDLRGAFSAAQDQIYYRTDHHWTAYGAYLAYSQYCAALGLEARSFESFGVEQVSDRFYGTIYSKTLDFAARPDAIYAPKALPEVTVTYNGKTVSSMYDESFLSQKDQYAYFFGGNWDLVRIDTQAGNGQRLLVIKDSFANSFVPYLTHDYEQIVMVDLRYFSGSVDALVQEYGITQVLVAYEMTNLLTDTDIAGLK